MAKQLVCSTSDVPAGKMKTFQVAGETILVYHLADGFYATQQRCTHTLAPLSRGSVLEDKMVQWVTLRVLRVLLQADRAGSG